jgi:hypothetical protein
VKESVNQEVYNTWNDHVKTLTVQGRFLEILHHEQSNITWKSIIYNLLRGALQFATNASIDTLATNANRKRWGKRNNAKCNSCGHRETLHHTLNNCDNKLDRYKWRHDSVLKVIHDTVKQNILPNCTISTDLSSEFQGATTLPIDIAITKQRPDIVLVN